MTDQRWPPLVASRQHDFSNALDLQTVCDPLLLWYNGRRVRWAGEDMSPRRGGRRRNLSQILFIVLGVVVALTMILGYLLEPISRLING